MTKADREVLADALPILRGRFSVGPSAPALTWRRTANPAGLEVDLADVAASLDRLPATPLPLVFGDRARGIEVALAESSATSPLKPLAGQIVAATGAASGIGAAIAAVFRDAGATVAGLDVNRTALAAVAEEVGCIPIACDVTDSASVRAAFDAVALACGGLDILVSNAGAASQGPIADTPLDTFQRSFDLNFFGHQRSCQEAMRIFRAQGRGGLLLFNISNQSVNPGRDFGPYGIPKAATMALMKQYALDHGWEGIRANGVNAGRVRTGLLTDEVIRQRAEARGLSPEDYMAGNLLGVEVTAHDVAEGFLHLALTKKVNAAVLTVDGGSMPTSLR